MLTEICQYLRNWFDRERLLGTFTITDGKIDLDGTGVVNGQYIRIIGSAMNDGVVQYPAHTLIDETFDGAVWLLAIPPVLVTLAAEIAAWDKQYGGADSPAMSPFQSESIPNYSYSMRSFGSGSGAAGSATWQDVYRTRLAPWRKI